MTWVKGAGGQKQGFYEVKVPDDVNDADSVCVVCCAVADIGNTVWCGVVRCGG
jgi:hypothetical protein